MLIETELSQYTPSQDSLLAIGVFDGVHLGHQHLLSQLNQQAQRAGLLSGVVTFREHPRQVLSGKELPLLTNLEERIGLIRGLGVKLVVPVSFTPELAQLSAQDFLRLLMTRLRMKGLVAGPNFALGREREGHGPLLRTLARDMGFSLTILPTFILEGHTVSSTAIRGAMAKGDIEMVSNLLGRPFRLKGPVVPGVERGRRLGFPTANIAVNSGRCLPADGVYVTLARQDDQAHPSVTNIGLRPTFHGEERTIEVHLLDFQGDLYGQELGLELVARLRGERHFASPQELSAQIEKDVEQARAILRLYPVKAN